MSDRARASARAEVVRPSLVLKSLPRQRLSESARVAADDVSSVRPRVVRGWVSSVWRRYLGLAVSADPYLTTVWVHGRCHDVSIYDRDWPESYLY